MNEEEKNAIEYLKTRLYGNEGCKYIDVAQEDLRTFINLVDRKEKEIEGWKKYCEEKEEEQTEMSNKNCELEFEVEKLQKENEELKNKLLDTLEGQKVIKEETPQYIKENFIPIEKVKDKIEEILNNKEYRIVFEGNAEFPDDATIINAQKYIKLEKMQELIEESEEK